MSLRTIFETCRPRADVEAGTTKDEQIAADLAQVVNRTAPKEYADPAVFFRHSYLTRGARKGGLDEERGFDPLSPSAWRRSRTGRRPVPARRRGSSDPPAKSESGDRPDWPQFGQARIGAGRDRADRGAGVRSTASRVGELGRNR